jgi:hypothetical protein
LSLAAKVFFVDTARLKPESKQFADKVKKVFSRVTDDNDYFKEMIKQVQFYHKCATGNLYCHLSRFFKKPETELPDKALTLITGYAESETLAEFRMRQSARN